MGMRIVQILLIPILLLLLKNNNNTKNNNINSNNNNKTAQQYLPCSICNVSFLLGPIQRHAINTKRKNSNVFTIYKESLLCENSTYKYDLHNKINM